MGLLDDAAAWIESLVSPGRRFNVCRGCVIEHVDKIIGEAGDYSLCARCRASITSKTGVEVLERSL